MLGILQRSTEKVIPSRSNSVVPQSSIFTSVAGLQYFYNECAVLAFSQGKNEQKIVLEAHYSSTVSLFRII